MNVGCFLPASGHLFLILVNQKIKIKWPYTFAMLIGNVYATYLIVMPHVVLNDDNLKYFSDSYYHVSNNAI